MLLLLHVALLAVVPTVAAPAVSATGPILFLHLSPTSSAAIAPGSVAVPVVATKESSVVTAPEI